MIGVLSIVFIECVKIWINLYDNFCVFSDGSLFWLFECDGFSYFYCYIVGKWMQLISGKWNVCNVILVDEVKSCIVFVGNCEILIEQ